MNISDLDLNRGFFQITHIVGNLDWLGHWYNPDSQELLPTRNITVGRFVGCAPVHSS